MESHVKPMQHISSATWTQEPGSKSKKQTHPRLVNYSRRLPHNPPPAAAPPAPCSRNFGGQRCASREKTPSLARDSTSTLPSSDSGSSIFSNLDDADDINWDMTSSHSGAPRLQMRRTSSCGKYNSKHVKAWLYDFPLPPPPHDSIEITDKYPRHADKYPPNTAEKHPPDTVKLAKKYPIDRPLNLCKATDSKRHGQKRESPPPPPPPPKDGTNKSKIHTTCSSRDLPHPLVPDVSPPLQSRRTTSRQSFQASSPTLHEPAAIQKPRRAPHPPPLEPVRDHLADYDPELGMVVRSYWDDTDSDDEPSYSPLERTRAVLGRVRALTNTTIRTGSSYEASCGDDSSNKGTTKPSRAPSRADSRTQIRAPSRTASRATSRPPSACGTTSRFDRQILPMVSAPLTSYAAPCLTRDKRSGSSASGTTIKSSASSHSLLRRAVHRVAGSF